MNQIHLVWKQLISQNNYILKKTEFPFKIVTSKVLIFELNECVRVRVWNWSWIEFPKQFSTTFCYLIYNKLTLK